MVYRYGMRRTITSVLLRGGNVQRHANLGCHSSVFQIHSSALRGVRNNHIASSLFQRGFSVEVSPTEHMNLIRQLRERTSAPVKDVKSALVSCNWDIEAAHKDLRKRGMMLAAKKSSRNATEGLLALAQNDKKAVVIELNCETDFVSRNEVFQHLASSLARRALETEESKNVFSFGPEYLENLSINLSHPKLSGETTVGGAVTEVAAMVGENVKFRRGFVLSTSSHGVISAYVHNSPLPGLGRIVGLVSLEVDDHNASVETLRSAGSSLAVHVVASRPLFLKKELVSSDALENELEIFKAQAVSSGKSEMAMEKMVEGRLRKYFEEVVFMEQKYFLKDNINIKTLLNELSKEVGSQVSVGEFMRLEVGEGIQRDNSSEAL